MIISKDALRRNVLALMRSIDEQIKEVETFASENGTDPHKVRDSKGNWVMVPLLLAKAQAYSTLVALQTSGR